MRRAAVTATVAGALALAVPAVASAGASDPPSCFGRGAAALAGSAPGAVGTFASEAAANFKATGGSIGQDGVPFLKATCAL